MEIKNIALKYFDEPIFIFAVCPRRIDYLCFKFHFNYRNKSHETFIEIKEKEFSEENFENIVIKIKDDINSA